jgi:hypothetical protein
MPLLPCQLWGLGKEHLHLPEEPSGVFRRSLRAWHVILKDREIFLSRNTLMALKKYW